MCGIAGMVAAEGLFPDDRFRVIRMRDVLTHRGPDDAGLYDHHPALLAHRRLSIVDLSTGHQPLSNEDGTIWIVFNGEIYNHADIRSDLETRGHCYRTKSDTETIVHAYEEWGDDCVRRFRGMFAFALWDEPKRRLLLVRDRLGVKPLYWTIARNALLFGSEIKALLASGLVQPRANEAVLPEVLSTRSIAGDETMFRGIQKLPPGHLLVYERGATRIRQYWDVPVGRSSTGAGASSSGYARVQRREGVDGGVPSARFVRAGVPVRGWGPARGKEVVAQFGSLLEDSVRLRLMSDVPLGMFLSGGIDSSAIAALMAGMIDRPLQTFSVAFADRAYNELEYSRQVARAIHADAHEVVINDRDFFGALPRLIWHEDEPIAHPSSVPLYFVSALARKHVTVVLTGEGSDELLAGYGKYPRIAWNWRVGTVYERMLPRRVRDAVASGIVRRLPGRIGRYARRSFLAMDRTPASMFLDNFAAIRMRDQRQLLAGGARERATPEHAYAASLAYFEHPHGRSTLLDRLLYADMKTYLVELLMKQDQMSMAASIESRVPFLDHHLVEFAAGLPDEWKLSGLTTKRVLRDAMKGLLPASILNRPKMGFPVPVGSWLRRAWNDTARSVLLDRRSRERGIVDPNAVDRLLRDHASGRTDGGDRLWTLLNLELWYRTFIDKDGLQTLPERTVQHRGRPVLDLPERHGARASGLGVGPQAIEEVGPHAL